MPSLEQLERLLAADPADPFTLYALAQAHGKEGRHARAVEFYDRCLAADPGYVYAYYHKARMLMGQDDQSGALAAAKAGLAKAREAAEAHAIGELLALISEIERP